MNEKLRWASVLALLAGCSVPTGRGGSEAQARALPQRPPRRTTITSSMFGYQDADNTAPLSHTFASVVHVGATVDIATISWLPLAFDGKVCVDLLHLRCPVETGKNYSLEETLTWAQSEGLYVGMWGPFEVNADLWNRVNSQIAYLDSGATDYVANDLGMHLASFRHNGGAVNCIHAVSDSIYFESTGLNWGLDGSKIVLEQMEPWMASTAPVDAALPYFPIAAFPVNRLAL